MVKNKKSLGILGGMGPKATAILTDNIINCTVATCDQEHINSVTIINSNIPDRTAAIKAGTQEAYQSVLFELVKSAKQLETLGVANIVVPCNTAMFWHGDVQKATPVPVINLIEETAKSVAKDFKSSKAKNAKVVLMATDGTVGLGLYHKAFEAHGIACVSPDADLQERIMNTIYSVKQTNSGDATGFHRLLYDIRVRHFKDEAELESTRVVLGCTELSWFYNNMALPPYMVDSVDVLTRVAIEKSGYSYDKPAHPSHEEQMQAAKEHSTQDDGQNS